MTDLLPAHLHPLTLAFDKALREGRIPLDVAEIFCDRIYEAMLEERVRRNPRLMKDPVTAGAVRAIGGQHEVSQDG